jgi:hypothetical protein
MNLSFIAWKTKLQIILSAMVMKFKFEKFQSRLF